MANKEHHDLSTDDNSLALFIESYGKQLASAAAAFLLLVVGIAFYYGSKSSAIERDYMAAENSLIILQRSALNQGKPSEGWNEALTRLLDILERQPSLQAKYDTPLAQLLVIENMDSAALPLLQRTWQRLARSDIPHLKTFGDITYLIGQQDYNKALTDNEQLLTAFNSAPDKQPLLQQYSALRGAFIQSGQNSQSALAIQQWQQLQERLQKVATNPADQPLAQLSSLMTNGDISLEDYVQHLTSNEKKSALTASN